MNILVPLTEGDFFFIAIYSVMITLNYFTLHENNMKLKSYAWICFCKRKNKFDIIC